MYVYKNTEPGLYTVGYYEPSGKWQPDSDHSSVEAAQDKVTILNGGILPAVLVQLQDAITQLSETIHLLQRTIRNQS